MVGFRGISSMCLEENAPALRHITLYQGGKAYGSDLGPYKTPAREDDPRLMPPNFYYDQEDLLRSRQKGSKWNFTILRPGGAICGISLGSPMNLIRSLRSTRRSLGNLVCHSAFQAPSQSIAPFIKSHPLTSSLAPPSGRGSPSCAKRALQRYQRRHPSVAAYVAAHGKDAWHGGRGSGPFSLVTYMAHKRPVWDAIVKKEKLQPIPYEQMVSWEYGTLPSARASTTSQAQSRSGGPVSTTASTAKPCFSRILWETPRDETTAGGNA